TGERRPGHADRHRGAVPALAPAGAVESVGGLGRRTALTTSATDVTAEVADVGSRVTSAQAVLATFRSRLPQATTIPDVLAIEGEIARRQADLEALQARQRALADSVELATLQVQLVRAPVAAAAADAEARGGFLGGLAGGWAALGRVVGVSAVLLGAVLPFALLAAVVVGPVLVLRRRRIRASATPPAA
ncbi:DUF4349 domain-containing protein, partial [Kineococcus sp. R8]|uniref:DUF4349 domain-containing protein n=1 Tax=Kineococcus siccus TaxID=2696567 RepID=UPI001411E8D9